MIARYLAAEHSGQAARQRPDEVLRRRRRQRLQRDRGAAGHRSRAEGRGRDDRRPPRLVAHRRRRHRQRRRIDDGDGGDADPEGDRRAAAADDPRRAVGRRGAGPARIEGLGRRSTSPATANAAARDKFDVYYNIDNGTGKIYGWFLQNQEEVRPIFDSWLEPLKNLGARRNVERAGRLHRSSELHRRRRSRLQPDPGLRQLRHPHAPHQHGHRRSPRRRTTSARRRS